MYTEVLSLSVYAVIMYTENVYVLVREYSYSYSYSSMLVV